jgi:thioredoxin-like negative regulator of GroEL
MNELTPQQIMQKWEQPDSDPYALYIYTPFCGTCKLTERMLHVIEELLPNLPLAKININTIPKLVQTWKITSVPCLLFIEKGEITKQIYAMKSIEHLYQLLQPLQQPYTQKEKTNHEQ